MPTALDVDPADVHTNIVMANIGPDLVGEGITASLLCDRLREKGVLVIAVTLEAIRFVTHSQVKPQATSFVNLSLGLTCCKEGEMVMLVFVAEHSSVIWGLAPWQIMIW